MTPWLEIRRGERPLLVTFPHTGREIPPAMESRLTSGWLSRKDADWWVHELYGMAAGLGATTVRTAIARTVIDVNRDPSGASLYPGQATTELCARTTFDGEPLYRAGQEPSAEEIASRRERYFDPYHAAIGAELERLRSVHPCIVIYDAHSIRSRIPRLFNGLLPQLNIGTNHGASCAPALTRALERVCAGSGFDHVINGRFIGGWTTRHYGRPERGNHAVQMELACRAYLLEPDVPTADNWPAAYDRARAEPLQALLTRVLQACLDFAQSHDLARARALRPARAGDSP